MLFNPELHGRMAQERIDRELAIAELLRRVQQPSQSIRRAVGHRFIQIGARLAAEPSLKSARSR